MKICLKIFFFVFLVFSTLMGHATEDNKLKNESDRYRPLSVSSITVGCTGITLYNYGPLGALMRGAGFLKKELEEFKVENNCNPNLVKYPLVFDFKRDIFGAEQVKKGKFIRHNHPGITVDIDPAIDGIRINHFRTDWLQYQYNGTPGSFEDIFFEQLPPAGDKGEKLEFMGLAIHKTHNLLRANGRLVMHLALDVNIELEASKEVLETNRSINPFIFSFNKTALLSVGKYIENPKNVSYADTHPVVQAFNFYEQNIKKLLVEALGEQDGEKEYNIIYNPYKISNTCNKDEEMLYKHRSKEIMDDIYKLLGLFMHKDRMINYLNNNGFYEAQLDWLGCGSHSFSPSGGWFVTAFKKE